MVNEDLRKIAVSWLIGNAIKSLRLYNLVLINLCRECALLDIKRKNAWRFVVKKGLVLLSCVILMGIVTGCDTGDTAGGSTVTDKDGKVVKASPLPSSDTLYYFDLTVDNDYFSASNFHIASTGKKALLTSMPFIGVKDKKIKTIDMVLKDKNQEIAMISTGYLVNDDGTVDYASSMQEGSTGQLLAGDDWQPGKKLTVSTTLTFVDESQKKVDNEVTLEDTL